MNGNNPQDDDLQAAVRATELGCEAFFVPDKDGERPGHWHFNQTFIILLIKVPVTWTFAVFVWNKEGFTAQLCGSHGCLEVIVLWIVAVHRRRESTIRVIILSLMKGTTFGCGRKTRG